MQDKKGIPRDQQRLIFAEHTLQNILLDNDIQKDATLHLDVRQRGGMQTIVLGRDIQNDTTLHLDLRLRGGMENPGNSDGKRLGEDGGLAESDIQKETTLHLDLRRGGMHNFVGLSACKTVNLGADASDTNDGDKATIQHKEGIPTDQKHLGQQRKIVAEVQLGDGRTRPDRNTRKDTTLQL